MSARSPRVAIHYRRPPDDLRVYDQRVVTAREDVIVTLSEPMRLAAPLTCRDRTMLEEGSLAVWFTFPGLWHDIGRFHLADGSLTGIYANVLTPPEMGGGVWRTTDLFLDVWWPTAGQVTLLDEDEFEEACRLDLIDTATATRARAEARTLMAQAQAGQWPPAIVSEWTLERSLAELDRHA